MVGSQRSGTTIAAQMIADDLDYDYIDETIFNVKDPRLFRKEWLKENQEKITILSLSAKKTSTLSDVRTF